LKLNKHLHKHAIINKLEKKLFKDVENVVEDNSFAISWKERIIIGTNNQMKSMFDIIVLLVIGINCGMNVFYFSYPVK